LLHSYTLGKATENVDWKKVKETVNYEGKEYKVYLIEFLNRTKFISREIWKIIITPLI